MAVVIGQPLFLLQVVDAENRVVASLPGGGPLETDLTELFVRHIVERGVGFWKTEAHVEQDIRQGIQAAILSLKEQTRFLV